MALTDAGKIEQARRVLAHLREAMQAWLEVDELRRKLPPELAAQVPASRYNTLLSIVSQLKSRGAIRTQAAGMDGYGAVPVVAIAVVAVVGIAGAAVVVAMWPTIQREHRAAMDARNKARRLSQIAATEQREAQQVGAEQARRRAQQRTAEAVQLYESGPPVPEVAFGPAAAGAGPPGAGAIYKALAPYAVPLLIIGGIILAVKLRQ